MNSVSSFLLALAVTIAAGFITWLVLWLLPFIIIALVAIACGMAAYNAVRVHGLTGITASMGNVSSFVAAARARAEV